MLERTDATTNDVLEPTTIVLAHPTLYIHIYIHIYNSLKGAFCGNIINKESLFSAKELV